MRETRLLRLASGEVHLLGAVHGLFDETVRVERAYAEVEPRAVGVGIAPGELEALDAHLQGEGSGEEEGEEEGEDEGDEGVLDPGEGYAAGLARFGEIGVPPPDLLAAVAIARERGLPLEPVDLDADQYDDVFGKNVGAFQLFRYGRRVQRMSRRPPKADSAEAFARAWDAKIRKLSGFDAVERARERQMAARLARLAGLHGRVLAVVDVTRADGVAALLQR